MWRRNQRIGSSSLTIARKKIGTNQTIVLSESKAKNITPRKLRKSAFTVISRVRKELYFSLNRATVIR